MSRLPAILLPLILIFATGCDVQKVAGITGGSTKLSGAHAAIGGLNYQGAAQAANDWHLTSCRQQPAQRLFVFGAEGAPDLLTLQIGTAPNQPQTLTLHPGGSSQPIRFLPTDCTVLKLDMTPDADHADAPGGKLSVACQRASNSVNGSVRFERCGP